MPSKHATTKKRASAGSSSANKRARGTASQPILINSQPQLPAAPPSPSSPPITNTLQALTSASQAYTFEARVQESRAKEAIVAPAEGSEHATAAASRVAEDEEDEEFEAFDAHLMDNYDGIDWSRLRRYQLPLTTHKFRKSWVYRHGYRVALRRNPACIFWVCHYCYQHKATDTGRGIFNTTASISAAARHLADEKPGHSILAPGKTLKLKLESSVYSALMAGKLPVSQAVANQLSGFNNQRFRLAAVAWLIDNNHPLSEFKKPAF
jgi:hypothetical protein